MKKTLLILLHLSIISFSLQATTVKDFVTKYIFLRDEYPHQYAMPLLEAFFDVSDFKNLTPEFGVIRVSIKSSHSKTPHECSMVAGFPNPCEFFKKTMTEFFSEQNLVNNQYQDITLTFTGFSPELVQHLSTQKKDTPSHKFLFNDKSITITLNQKFFEDNKPIITKSLMFCSLDPFTRMSYKTSKDKPLPENLSIMPTIEELESIVDGQRVEGKPGSTIPSQDHSIQNSSPVQTNK